MTIRQPIVSLLGHVDHGKTTLLDSIRGTAVNIAEPGQITQHIGASFVPIETVEKLCGDLLRKFKIKITISGLLFIDTPGHEAFTTLRKRGGSVSDLAILVIDINEGFQPQTDESLEYLKQFRVPFIVAATKIDVVYGWYPYTNLCFLDSFRKQSENVKKRLDDKLYRIVSQLMERGFEAERFDRVSDFKKQISIVPCSGKTHEGVPELLLMLTGLAQRFLKDKLKVSKTCRGNVLEVKEVRGLGTTIDAIIYDGSVRVGDFLIIGGKEPLVTRIKALLRPPALRELRIEKQFESVKEIHAAAGIKISAPNLDNVISGSPIICVSDEKDIENAKKLVQKEVEEVEFAKDVDGVIVKADSLGSLEALIKMLTDKSITIRRAEVGAVNKQDVIEAQNVKDDSKKVILAFNVKPLEEAENLARDLRIKIFWNNIIYRLIEDYEEWCYEKKERERKERLERLIWPGKIKLLGKDFVFRASKPAIVGVEVLVGRIKPKVDLLRKDGRDIGKIIQIQDKGKTIEEARKGDRIAVSIEGPTVGRQISDDEVLYVRVPSDSLYTILTEFKDKVTGDDMKLIEELKNLHLV